MTSSKTIVSATILLLSAASLSAVEVSKSIPSDDGFAHDFGKQAAGALLAINVSADAGYTIWNNHVRNPGESGWHGGPRFTYSVPPEFTSNNGLFRGNYGRPGGTGTAPEWNGSAKAAAKVLRPGTPQIEYTDVDIEAIVMNEENGADTPAAQTRLWKVRYQDDGDQGQDTAIVTARFTVRVRAVATVYRPFYDIFGSGEAACAAYAYGEGGLVQQAQAAQATSSGTFSLPVPNPITGGVSMVPIPIQTGNGTNSDIKPDTPLVRTLGTFSHAPRSLLGPYQTSTVGVASASCKIRVNLAIRASAVANAQIIDNSSSGAVVWTLAE
jgi:hypothetical protein